MPTYMAKNRDASKSENNPNLIISGLKKIESGNNRISIISELVHTGMYGRLRRYW